LRARCVAALRATDLTAAAAPAEDADGLGHRAGAVPEAVAGQACWPNLSALRMAVLFGSQPPKIFC
jgi:hypothetical protein